MNKNIALTLSLATLLTAFAPAANAQQVSVQDNKVQDNNYNNYYITDGKGTESIQAYASGHWYTMRLVNNQLTALCIDNKKIADSNFAKYQSVITNLMETIRRDEAQGEKDRAQGEKDRLQGEKDRIQGEKDRIQGEKDRIRGEKDRLQGERDRIQGDKDRAQGDRDRIQGDKDRAQGDRDRKQAAEDRKRMKQLIDDLVAKKLIPDASALKSLEAINHRLSDAGVQLHLSEVKGPVMDRLQRSDLLDRLTGCVFLSQYEAFLRLTGAQGAPVNVIGLA